MVELETVERIASYPKGMSGQALVNGNFDIWQRGITSNPVNNVGLYTADRWGDYHFSDGGTLPTLTRTRQILTAGDITNAFYFTRLNVNSAGSSLGVNSDGYIYQNIENGTRFLCGANKKLTLSFWARSSIANKKIGVELFQAYGNGGSPSAGESIVGTNWTLTSNWTKYTYTFTTNTLVGKTFGTDNFDVLAVVLHCMWGSNAKTKVGASSPESYVGSGNIDIAQVQLCAGSEALPFDPRSFDQELKMCMRYYQKGFTYGQAPANNAEITWRCALEPSGSYCRWKYDFPVPMRTTPTVTTYGVSTANWDYFNGSTWVTANTDGYWTDAKTLDIEITGGTGALVRLVRGQWSASAD